MNDIKLTPTQDLILDVLSARIRLGEQIWTFNTRLKVALEGLSQAGIISYRSGIVENTYLVSFANDEAKAKYISATYVAPIFEDYIPREEVEKNYVLRSEVKGINPKDTSKKDKKASGKKSNKKKDSKKKKNK